MSLILGILIVTILILLLFYATFKMNYYSYRTIKQILAFIKIKKILNENTIMNESIVIGKVVKRKSRLTYSRRTGVGTLYYTKLEIYDISNEKDCITLDSDHHDIYSTFTNVDNEYEFTKTEYLYNDTIYIVYKYIYNDDIKNYIFINKPYNEIVQNSKLGLFTYIFSACIGFPIAFALNIFSIYTFYALFENWFILL